MGNDLSCEVTPFDVGYHTLVDFSKSFIGKETLIHQRDSQKQRYRVPFTIEQGGLPRHGCQIFNADQIQIGIVTSGTFSPTCAQGIGLARCDMPLQDGEALFFDIRGRLKEGRVATTPFVKETSLKIKPVAH